MVVRNSNKSKHPQGFTLIEMIIAMLIFTLFIGVVASVYIQMSRTLRQASEVRKVYAEARFLMDKITQDARLYTIDYDCYEDSENPNLDYGTYDYNECSTQLADSALTDQLNLISADGTHRIIYKFEPGEEEDEGGVLSVIELDLESVDNEGMPSWAPSNGYYEDFIPIETSHVELAEVQFAIAPLSSPYTNFTDNEYQFQPSVNVVIEARSRSSLLPEAVQVNLQSTISSRVYGVGFDYSGEEEDSGLSIAEYVDLSEIREAMDDLKENAELFNGINDDFLRDPDLDFPELYNDEEGDDSGLDMDFNLDVLDDRDVYVGDDDDNDAGRDRDFGDPEMPGDFDDSMVQPLTP